MRNINIGYNGNKLNARVEICSGLNIFVGTIDPRK